MDQDFAVTTKQNQRIISLDIIRGFFLAVILVNHIELYPNFFDLFTGRGRLFVSAAEGFFFMSGLLVGMVYKRRLDRGMKFIFTKMRRRAIELYAGSVFFTILFTWLAITFSHPSIKDGLYPITDWPHIISNSFLMRYNFGWADFLDRFALMMFLAPFGFYLLTKRKWWLVILVSIIVWAGPGNNNPLDTLNWQIIFNVAMVIGFYWHELRTRVAQLKPTTARVIKRTIFAVSAVTFAISYASVYLLSLLNQKFFNLSAGWQHFTLDWNTANAYVWQWAQKWTVGPLRLALFAFWFAALFMIVEKYSRQINRLTKNVLLLFGQNSLFVYIAHAFVVFGFKFFITPGHPIFDNFAITAAALASLFALTWVYTKLRPARQPNAKTQPERTSSARPRPLKAKTAQSN